MAKKFIMNAIRTGDYVCWEKPVYKGGNFFRGRYKGGAKLIRTEIWRGIVIKHSYGKDKGQHTFTIVSPSRGKVLVKGRNLYPNIIKHIVNQSSEDRITQLF